MGTLLKEKLAHGQTVFGTWVSLADPACTEILSQSGFDFLLIDGERAPIGEESLRNMVMAAKGNDAAIIYRVRQNNEALIKIALDLGVDGLFIPMVNSAADAKQAVSATRYPPLGKRGVGPWRASNYFENMWEYIAQANEHVTLIIQIEDVQAVENIDEILAVPGFDVAFIGPADLTASLNLLPDTQHPEVTALIERVAAKCQAAKIPLGIDAAGPDHIRAMSNLEIQLFTYGMDISYLIEGARGALAEAKSACEVTTKNEN